MTTRGGLAAVRRGDGTVSVNIGSPQLDWAQVPLARAVETLHLPLAVDPVAVGMGNPHCVFFVGDAEAVDLAAVGPEWERDALFPERTNVEFAQVIGPDRLRMRVWERGFRWPAVRGLVRWRWRRICAGWSGGGWCCRWTAACWRFIGARMGSG